MTLPTHPVVIIPARMAARRLPGKPLAAIDGAGTPMIVHVLRRAEEADIGPVYVACGEAEIAAAVESAGGAAVMTRPDHASGSDRVHEALGKVNPGGRFDAIVNFQGDLPVIDPDVIRAVLRPLEERNVDIATLAIATSDAAAAVDPNTVKVVLSLAPGADVGRALYFTRAAAPAGEGPLYHHLGIYAFRPEALARFVALPPAPLEKRERLEQLRALEAGMRIDAALVDSPILEVNTPADLERVRAELGAGRAN